MKHYAIMAGRYVYIYVAHGDLLTLTRQIYTALARSSRGLLLDPRGKFRATFLFFFLLSQRLIVHYRSFTSKSIDGPSLYSFLFEANYLSQYAIS